MNKSVKLLLYCTKAKPYLYGCYAESDGDIGTIGGFGYDTSYCPTEDEDKDRTINLNSKIVAEAECKLVEEIEIGMTLYDCNSLYINGKYINEIQNEEKVDLLKKSCLTSEQLLDYLECKDTAYAIYLKNVKPFETPKELSEYFKIDGYEKGRLPVIIEPLKKSFQNMGYALDEDQNLYVVISIRPEWLCKILNGEKTIEVRKSILNLLKEVCVCN